MELKRFFMEHPKVAIAFSGGVDSAYLLYAATQSGADVKAYYVKSAFQPQFELDDVKALAEQLDVQMKILPLDILSHSAVTANPENRCYHCKIVKSRHEWKQRWLKKVTFQIGPERE